MIEQRLPIATRWTLYALGAVEGQRVRRPRDPVAAWLLRRHPQLLPTFAAPSILAMIRARANIVDRMIEETVNRARLAGDTLDFWGFGGGFDARWYRLMRDMGDVIASHQEVEEPALMEFKDELLASSSFANAWDRIEKHSAAKHTWTVGASNGSALLVILEGVSTRLGPQKALALLARLRQDAPQASVIIDLPGFLNSSVGMGGRPAVVGSVRSRWSSATSSGAAQIKTAQVVDLGFEVVEDTWFAARPELRAPSGMPICSGMEAFRVMMLQPAKG